MPHQPHARRPTPRHDAGAARRAPRRVPWRLLALACCAVIAVGALVRGVTALVGDPGGVSAAPSHAVADAHGDEVSQSPSSVEVLMVGDILMHSWVYQSGEREDGGYDFTHLFSHISDDLAAADLAMLDQETILGGTELGLSGYPLFNSPQEVGDFEVSAGFNCILMASNHTMDQGDEGVRRAVTFWRTRHPDTLLLGAVMPGEEVAAEAGPAYFEKDGLKVAVLNYTYGLNDIPDPSDAVCEIDEDQMRRDVAEAESEADLTVVCPHWGEEGMRTPTDEQRALAAKMCDWGVDLVLGNHPHVIQPIEVIVGTDGHEMPVYWSVGNFISTQIDPENLVGGMAKATLVKDADGARVEAFSFVPTVTHRGFGADMTTYRLSDYTDGLAATNAVRESDPTISPEEAKAICAEVLGSGFDETTCVWHPSGAAQGTEAPAA